MKALIVAHARAEPTLADIAPPNPGTGEVIIDVAACGLNFADLLMIKGTYQEQPAFPMTPGMEVAGTIASVAPGVEANLVGQRVAAICGHGGLAEKVAVPAARCVPLPETIETTKAAALQVAYGTSHLALTHVARLQATETLLVTGAAGGVGLSAVELGSRLGARVIAVARGEEKCSIAREAGADHTIDATSDTLLDDVRALGRAHVVYDTVGGPQFADLVRATAPGGRILLIGFASGTLPDIRPNHLLVKNISVHGFFWGGYLAFDERAFAGSLRQIFDWAAKDEIRPHVSHVLPLSRATEGLALLSERKSTGKVVITP